ncbi:MAG TPA: triose-phosphate isomerase [Candidatus Dormibacteraeota bacterium]|nr:triose-phosphate isomerase [Candidatus Dormibacteraeota bacterium]
MRARTPLLAGNWKMHCRIDEALSLVDDLLGLVRSATDRDILVAPPFTAVAAVAQRLAGSRIQVAGQDLYWEDKGAYTGEVSGPMLAAAGCTHVIVGHSERRQLFGDSDDWVARKTAAALRADLTPIVCVGETLGERDADTTLAVVERQVRAALSDLGPAAMGRIVVAYEPVWAIGTGKVATPEQAQEVHRSIRGILTALSGTEIAAAVRILYGGSVKPDNIDALMAQPDLDGALVGGASLQAADFARIVAFNA